jgi:ACS family tartrate transporter-like MFS transporter
VRWLVPEERQWLAAELQREREEKKKLRHFGWQNHLLMVLLLTAVYFFQNVTSYGLSTFMPKFMKFFLTAANPALASDPSQLDFWAAIVGTLPYCMAVVALLVNGWHSDKTGERAWHAAVPLLVSAAAIVLVWSVSGEPLVAISVIILIVGSCLYTHIPAFWPIPTMLLGASAAASAIGFINMVGNLGGSLGQYRVGKASGTSVPDALLRMAPWSALAAVILIGANIYRKSRMGSPPPE